MRLEDLILGIYESPLKETCRDIEVKRISCDSREDQGDGIFVALPGFKVDGNDFIKDALAKGARVIVKKKVETSQTAEETHKNVCVLSVDDPKRFLKDITLRFYNYPSKRIGCVGITGTNGKTTISYLIESILSAFAKTCGVVGTVNYRVGSKILPSKNTTPGFLENQKLLYELASLRVDYCVMEVSSHALHQGRVDGIEFGCAIFTNLTQDHLDYHKSMEEYFQAKALLFTQLNDKAFAVINIDDPYGKHMVSKSKGQIVTYGLSHQADIWAENIQYDLRGTTFDINHPSGKLTLRSSLIGQHNVYNILAAVAFAYVEGITVEAIAQGVEGLSCVPGRLEAVKTSKNFHVFIDYAHTDDGLINVLKSLRAVSKNRIILVFGCGGDRDRGKRPLMGKAACELADFSMVTSDNPRSEDPLSIIKEIVPGFSRKNYEICVDRKQAIARALAMAQKDEIVLLAGKGHEDYQILKDQTIRFDERMIVAECLQSMT